LFPPDLGDLEFQEFLAGLLDPALLLHLLNLLDLEHPQHPRGPLDP
jgi:hypothetical protein